MSSSANEDQERRENAEAEDSDSKTIEFLRARLLSERSISKTARQRADDLAKRVTELEKQLKFVSFQRKKAEKATSEVLAILENCGVSDVSEGFDSCSDENVTPHEIQACNGSNDIKLQKNEAGDYSSSEFEYTQSTGRSLSWKSSKNSQYSLGKKKYTESVRRRDSVSSNSSSARRVGKSCRKIRRRENRSPEELQTDGLEQVTCHTDLSNCSDGGQYESREIIGRENENSLEQQQQILCSSSETPKSNGRSSPNYEDMESALNHQVQLIGQYEAEEKAQNEWEETSRKNNTSSQQDSCDLGNHSDVTEERYDIKSPQPLLLSDEQPLNSKQEATQPTETSGHAPPHPVPMSATPQDQNMSTSVVACEPSASEFSFPSSKDTAKQEFPRNHHNSSNELIVVPQKTAANNLESVLKELQRAKLSLSQKLSTSPPLTDGISGPEINNKDHGFKVPFTPPSLFRLPTYYQYPATTVTNHQIIDERFSSTYPPGIGGNRFLPETSIDSRTALSGANHSDITARASLTSFSPEIASARNLFRTVPSQPVHIGIGSGPPSQMYLSQPRTNQLDPYMGTVISTDRSSNPLVPNTGLRLPLNEGTSRTFSNAETWLPPITRVSLYDDVVRRNMHM